MFVSVKFVVNLGALEPEIRAQVDDLAALLEQGNGKFRRDTMWQREKNNLCNLRKQVGLGFGRSGGFLDRG